MSVIGKRVIFVGPADGANSKPLNVEGVALDAIAPGTLVVASTSGLAVSAAAATVFGEITLIAGKDSMRQKSIDDAWVISENMVSHNPRSGEFYNVLTVTGQVLVADKTALTRNGSGLLVIAATDGSQEIVAIAGETVTTIATQLVCVRFV